VVTALARLRDMDPKRVAERARRLGLELESVSKVRFRDLSGGTKQKVLAALSLATEAPILVCDEPTANLDAAARAAFFAELDARPKHHVTILCSHRIDEVQQLVDRVVELEEGRLRRDASVSELLADRKLFRVEVLFAGPVPASARLFLDERGFAQRSGQRFEALVTQVEKVSVVAHLLREHGSTIADMSVYHVDDFEEAAGDRDSAERPVLKVV
jgi:ABC-type multidrug transport system ATPase subunit